ncbi:Vesicle transport protein GOT1 [Sesamum angolense]|uniref:Vesicle transport protein GOT1 n=1 Tax=Sesamum angolense TaxID=2727404 RepID=A0AAE2C6L5_9LAMI|nr:Vesicle transport protein GOT1 [Sesamum angolense]
MVSFETSDLKKVGLGLTGFGLIFTFAGVLLIFDKGFLTIGNILFLSGMILTIGMKSSLHFFMKPQNYKMAYYWHDCRDIWFRKSFQYFVRQRGRRVPV